MEIQFNKAVWAEEENVKVDYHTIGVAKNLELMRSPHTGTNLDKYLQAAMIALKLSSHCGFTKSKKVLAVVKALLKSAKLLDIDALIDSLVHEPDSYFWNHSRAHIMMVEHGITEHMIKNLYHPGYFGKTHKLTIPLTITAQNVDDESLFWYQPGDDIGLAYCDLIITVKLSKNSDIEDEN